MWFADHNRDRFLKFLLSKNLENPSHSTFEQNGLLSFPDKYNKSELRLVWSQNPENGGLPCLLVIRKSDRQDFFAWVNTYLRGVVSHNFANQSNCSRRLEMGTTHKKQKMAIRH